MPAAPSPSTWALRSRAQVAVVGLAALLVATGLVAVVAQQQVDRAHRLVTERWLPAQIALERMQKAQLDQQTSVRGYVLTAQQSLLAPFREAQSALPQEEGSLRRALADDQAALRQLDDVVAAYTDWATAAGAQVVRVDQGRLDEARQVANVANGAPRFDALRGRVEALRTTIQSRVDTATAELARVRRTMLTLLGIAVALGLALSVVLLVGLRRGVTRPLGQLVDAVTGVAEGQLERPVHVIGPREIESVAEAAERMRRALRQHADDEVIGAEREARLQESERIAVQLQETVVTRLFATGMAVLSVINRSPQLAGSLRGVVDELDAVGQELRTIALGLSGYATPSPVDLRRVVARAAEVARNDLGLAVHVRYDGPIDEVTNPNLVDEVASTLRDVLVELAESTVETVDVKVAALPSPVRDQVDAVRLGLTFEPSASLPNGLAAGRNDGPRWASELPDGRFGLEWDLGATDAGPVIEESRRDGRLT